MASKSNQENDHDIDDDHHEIKKATPAVIRTRQFRNFFPVSSPSDNIMSPCTQKLVGARIGTGPYETRNLKTSDNLPINSKITQTKQMDGNKLDFDEMGDEDNVQSSDAHSADNEEKTAALRVQVSKQYKQ